MVALSTICLEGLGRVEDHLKGKDPEKQKGDRGYPWNPSRLTRKDLKMSLLPWKHRSWVGKEEQIPGLLLKISRSES